MGEGVIEPVHVHELSVPTSFWTCKQRGLRTFTWRSGARANNCEYLKYRSIFNSRLAKTEAESYRRLGLGSERRIWGGRPRGSLYRHCKICTPLVWPSSNWCLDHYVELSQR